MELLVFGKVSDKIHTRFLPRVVINTKGYKVEDPCQIGLEQLQTSQLEERALQFNNIQTFNIETWSQSRQF